MKAKYLMTKEVELKAGDRVAVYETRYYPKINGTPRGASTWLFGSGYIVRVYKHIGAVVVRFGGGTQFIRQNDPRYSIWRAS